MNLATARPSASSTASESPIARPRTNQPVERPAGPALLAASAGGAFATTRTSSQAIGDCPGAEAQTPTGKINGWKTILNTLTVHYGDRVTANTIN
ncbi:MAG: hypothetical protein ACRDWD_06715 [Acidimicrobiia bacterium]